MKFKVGDFCVTQNSRVPVLNDNQLVVIISIHPGKTCAMGEEIPYRVRRIDGEPLRATISQRDGEINWCKNVEGYCPEYMLKKPKKSEYLSKHTKKVNRLAGRLSYLNL